MVSINIQDWTEDENPNHVDVIDALSAAGVDLDNVAGTPDNVWHIYTAVGEITLGFEHDHESGRDWWTATKDDHLFAEGHDLLEVAADVAARARA